MRKLYTMIALCVSAFTFAQSPTQKELVSAVAETQVKVMEPTDFVLNGKLGNTESPKISAPAKAPASLNDLVGVYDYVYYGNLENNSGYQNSTVEIQLVDEADGIVSLEGFIPGYTVEGIYDAAEGTLTIPSGQFLYHNTRYDKDIVSCVGVWNKAGDDCTPSLDEDYVLLAVADGFESATKELSIAAASDDLTLVWFFLAQPISLSKQKPAEWSAIGTAQFFDGGLFAGLFVDNVEVCTVNVEKDATVKGHYRLVNPWDAAFQMALNNSYLEFNCTDITNVVIPENKTGISDQQLGSASVLNWAGNYESAGYSPSQYKPVLEEKGQLCTLVGNTIKMPVSSTFTLFANDEEHIYYVNAANGGVDSYIVLDESVMKDIKEAGIGTGVDAIVTTTADANGKAYNVMGQQVNAANAKGIIIKNGKKFITNK